MSLIKVIKKGLLILGGAYAAILMCHAAQAQEITAINFSGEVLGKVIPDGKVVGLDNRLLGNVTADGLIVNAKGELIGGVVPQGVAIGNDARLLGKVGNDGSVRSASGQIIGKVLPNGLVVNDFFDALGQVIFAGLVYNDEGKIAGRITGDGLYTSLNGQQIGIVTPDGYAYRKIGNDYLLDGRLISAKMVVSLSGDFIGSVVPGGQVTDFNSKIIGKIKANGFVYDSENNIIGKIVSSGYAFDNDGFYLGYVSYNGEVTDKNKTVGKVRADGLVVNVNGAIIGTTQEADATATDLNGRYLGRIMPEGNIAGASTTGGLVGARGIVSDASGNAIGRLVKTGPVYDYKGELKGHALSNGAVIALSGTTIGYMVGDEAYNLSGIMIGKVLEPHAVYTADGSFIGMSGINSTIASKGGKLSVSPFGYVFGQNGAVEGRALPLGRYYMSFGTISSYQGLNGKAVNAAGSDFGRIVGAGYVLNQQNNFVSQGIRDFLAVTPKGGQIGLLNEDNQVLDKSLNSIAKILPDGSVSEIRSGNLNYMPKIGQAYKDKMALDFSGTFFGYADINGSINNLSGAKVGRVIDRGLVADNNGIVIGYLTGYKGAIDNKCNLIGVISSAGGVYNYRGIYIGKVLEDNTVISESGSTLGYTVNETPVIDFNGRIIGFTAYDGSVKNEQGEYIGCLNKDGRLYNVDKALIGKAISYESIIDFEGNIIGYSTIDGLFVDSDNNLKGYQQPNDNINSTAGLPLGMLMKYKIAFSLDNKFIGYIAKDGKVIDSKGQEAGKVDFDGYIVSGNSKIGYALNDFYLYDETGKLVGLITRNGEATSFTNQNLGKFDRGFVIKGEKVVARGNRDYNIRDKSHLVLGKLALDGKVRDNLENIVGTLTSSGAVVNAKGEVIAVATPLQFYNIGGQSSKGVAGLKAIYDANGNLIGYLDENGNLLDANGNIIGRLDENGNLVDVNGNIIGKLGKDGVFRAADGQSSKGVAGLKAIYDANGNLIGYLDENGNLLDANGNIIGRLDENGNLVDVNGNIIGKLGADGVLRDADGNAIGKAVGLRPIYDANGNLIGYLDENGNLLDANGNIIGHLDENGNLIDLNGNIIGKLADDGTLLDQDGNPVGKINGLRPVYDADGTLIGYFDENGNFIGLDGKIKGKLDENGNLADADGNIIGKVGEDGLIKDKDGNLLGRVAKGTPVYDEYGNLIGYVMPDGTVVDINGNVIGNVLPDGTIVDMNGNVIGSTRRKWFDKASIVNSDISRKKEDVSPALKLLEDSNYYKSLGIALTPDGDYLGDILEDDTVVDEKGNIIGYRMPDGLIIDDDGNLIGTEEIEQEDADKNNIFIPAGTFGPGGAYGTGNGSAENLGPGGGYGPGERYDPMRKAALEAAMLERRQNISVGKISSGIRKEAFDGYQKDWSEQGIPKSISSWRVDMSEMIFSDKPIPAVIARAIDTNNPAPVTAYVERNVYAEEGRNIIIPAGSRLIGSFGSITAAAEATSESARVQISWERLIRPDGSIFVFTGQTADAQGRAGALGYVDQQLFKKYTLPIVTTVLSSGASYFIASAEDSSGSVETSKQQAASDARQNFLTDMESLFDEILSDKTDVKAMTYIPAGTRIIVYPNTDLWLRTAERDEDALASYEKPTVFLDDVKTEAESKEKERKDIATASSSVVYEPDNVDVEAKSAGSPPLIDDTASQKKKTTITPPPPSAGSIPAARGNTTMTKTTTASSSGASSNSNTNNSIPALF